MTTIVKQRVRMQDLSERQIQSLIQTARDCKWPEGDYIKGYNAALEGLTLAVECYRDE